MTYQYIDLETIRSARKIIARNESPFICTAISSGMTEATAEEFESKKRMLALIKALLGKNSTYVGWLQENHPELLPEDGKYFRAKIKKSRIAWLKWISIQLRTHLRTGESLLPKAA